MEIYLIITLNQLKSLQTQTKKYASDQSLTLQKICGNALQPTYGMIKAYNLEMMYNRPKTFVKYTNNFIDSNQNYYFNNIFKCSKNQFNYMIHLIISKQLNSEVGTLSFQFFLMVIVQ